MTAGRGRFLRSSDLWWPLAIFAALVGFKLLFVTGPTLGATISDEDVYWRLSQIFADGVFYQGTKYPPLYPAALVPAHLFGVSAYKAALILNSIYSSTLVLPVYALGRILTDRKRAVLVTLLAAIIPYHYILPRTLMSENIYFPLLMLAVFAVIWRPKRGVVWFDLATGCIVGALYLTRYVSLVVIPALAIAWWLREWEHTGRWYLDRGAWGRLAVVGVGFVAVFAPWVWIERSYGLSVKSALGFGVTSTTNPEQHTLERLGWYVRMYAAYFVLLATPVAGLVALSAGRLRRGALGLYGRFCWLSVLLSGALLVALSRHSWRAAYNYPEAMRIMGRYAIYLAVIYLLLAFATLVRWEKKGNPVGYWVAAIGLPVSLVAVSYFTVLGDWVLPLTHRMITDRGSVDAYRMLLMGPWFWVLGVGAIVAVGVTLRLRGRESASWVAAIGTAAFLLVGAPQYMAHIQSHQGYVEHARQIVQLSHATQIELPLDVHVTDAVLGTTGFPSYIVQSGMRLNVRFPEREHIRVYVAPGPGERPPHVIVSTLDEVEVGDDVLLEYDVRGESFAIVASKESSDAQ